MRCLGSGRTVPRLDGERTAVGGFVGLAEKGPLNEATPVNDWLQFSYAFGGHQPGCYLAHAVYGLFANGGGACWVVRVGDADGSVSVDDLVTGIQALGRVDAVTIIATPDIVGLYERGLIDAYGVRSAQATLINQCEGLWNRLTILDPLPKLTAYQVSEFVESFAEWESELAA